MVSDQFLAMTALSFPFAKQHTPSMTALSILFSAPILWIPNQLYQTTTQGEAMNRREFTLAGVFGLSALSSVTRGLGSTALCTEPGTGHPGKIPAGEFAANAGRPPLSQRAFVSEAVENTLRDVKSRIRSPQLATLFENCYPNTLDTTVHISERRGKPDTFVITGDIAAMWLRDSSAQVQPYLPLAVRDSGLRRLFGGLIHRQASCILLDAYANAFYSSTNRVGPFAHDLTDMRPGVHERKWEVDSLCYPVSLGYRYWKTTGDTDPLDDEWRRAATRVVAVFREQQRLKGDGPYRFQRLTTMFYDNSPNRGLGNPTRKIGLVHAAFRPSDDACLFPFLIPANLFAAVALRQLHSMASEIFHDQLLADDAAQLAEEIDRAVGENAVVDHRNFGTIYAYEIDGMGNALMMDDANVPSLLSLPYLGCCAADDPLYRRTRAFVLSESNPFFCRGVVEGIGSPHVGPGKIWPLSIIMRAMTTDDDKEIEACLRALIVSAAGTGFMHESFDAWDPLVFTRPWFAWCNSAFGELIVTLSRTKPHLLEQFT
jgi:meiotically up-regulated gene 157 (Mug157) protein